jgi:hypothetical protein
MEPAGGHTSSGANGVRHIAAAMTGYSHRYGDGLCGNSADGFACGDAVLGDVFNLLFPAGLEYGNFIIIVCLQASAAIPSRSRCLFSVAPNPRIRASVAITGISQDES